MIVIIPSGIIIIIESLEIRLFLHFLFFAFDAKTAKRLFAKCQRRHFGALSIYNVTKTTRTKTSLGFYLIIHFNVPLIIIFSSFVSIHDSFNVRFGWKAMQIINLNHFLVHFIIWDRQQSVLSHLNNISSIHIIFRGYFEAIASTHPRTNNNFHSNVLKHYQFFIFLQSITPQATDIQFCG